jgi:hypothetical protein
MAIVPDWTEALRLGILGFPQAGLLCAIFLGVIPAPIVSAHALNVEASKTLFWNVAGFSNPQNES